MAISVDSVIQRVQKLVQDETGIRWPDTELLMWLNDAQREVVMLVPKAGAANASVVLSAGTKQRIPSDGIQLLRVVRNMGADGETPGRAIREVDRDILDAQHPEWHSATAQPVTLHYTFDPVDPRTYYVYPPAPGGTHLEVVYAAAPQAAMLGGPITIPDIYNNALVDYMLYRAYGKDAESTENRGLSDRHYQQFANALGQKQMADAAADMASSTHRPAGS